MNLSTCLDERAFLWDTGFLAVDFMAEPSAPGSVKVRSEWEKSFEGFRWRVLVSIVGPVAWLSFTLLYVGFWATGFTLFQSIIVIIVSALILGGLMAALWTSWGPRYRRGWDWGPP